MNAGNKENQTQRSPSGYRKNLKGRYIVACLILLTSFSHSHFAAEPQIIINPLLDINNITRSKARSIFSMRLYQWADGTPVVVYVLPDDSSQHRLFVQNILSMFPHQLRRQWDRYTYTGIGQAPIEVTDEQEMIERVNSTLGAIGYIEKGASDAKIRRLNIE